MRPIDMAALAEFRTWREALVAESGFSCEPIDFAASTQWRFEDGILRHRTGGFFSLAGLATRARRPELDGREQLIILQPETAINGLLMRRGRDGGAHHRQPGATRRRGGELLFQGRVEPGSKEALQLAPTVQSTEANFKRLHGGAATAFLEHFMPGAPGTVVFDELQSEEGSRYFGKYNRNVVVDVGALPEPELPPTFRWVGVDALRTFVVTSNVVNTDARSVLAGLDWDLLLDGDAPAFAGHPAGSFGAALSRSYTLPPEADVHSDADVLAWLMRLRVQSAVRHTVLPLDRLRNWVVERDRIRERTREHGFVARQFAVRARGREVAAWDQPLIDSDGVGLLCLVGQQQGDVMRFLVKASHEIGYLEGVQVSATLTRFPGEAERSGADPIADALSRRLAEGRGLTPLVTCRQSEEGGRFHHDENDYQLAVLDPDVALDPARDYRWLSLAQIKRLIRVPGVFAIELRGVLALLLGWL